MSCSLSFFSSGFGGPLASSRRELSEGSQPRGELHGCRVFIALEEACRDLEKKKHHSKVFMFMSSAFSWRSPIGFFDVLYQILPISIMERQGYAYKNHVKNGYAQFAPHNFATPKPTF